MSELIQKHDNRATIRWKLLTGVSALALAAYVSSAGCAKAEDTDHPLIWLELDGQFSQQKSDVEVYSPPFLAASPFDAISHLGLEKAPPTIWDKGAAITFQPSGTEWVLSASIHYGKNARGEAFNQLTAYPSAANGYGIDAYQRFRTHSSESHIIVDFLAGKDVGIGRFGSSVFSAGVRIAQFHSRSSTSIHSQPTNVNNSHAYNKFYASFAAKRSFTGIGPALSWDASANIAGNPSDGGISLDWGVNGAVLFGRQRVGEHRQVSEYHSNHFHRSLVYRTPASPSLARSKNVTVPNLGAFAGVSWRYADAKISMGYRADYFFGAIDGGIDTAKKEDRAFYGPYASISIGLGD